MIRKWELNVEDPSRWQYIIGEEPKRYYLRQSNFSLNYLAYFIENFEDTYQRKARIIEYGAGCTTVWWAKNFPDNEFVAVEGNRWWFDTVNAELKKVHAKNVRLVYYPADENYTTVRDSDLSYSKAIMNFNPPFDLIINDGAQREIIGDFVLRNADSFISPGGLYLRHDMEMAMLGNWVGFREDPLPGWCRDKMDLGYEGFAHDNPAYACVTVTGNHIASMVIEFGGVWRKADFKFIQKMKAEEERLKANG